MALRLWREAAEQGVALAMLNLGIYYDQTASNSAELVAAAAFYRDAATAGNHEAEYRLGILYREGRGVRSDLQLAEFWFLRAAESGNISAQQALVDLYSDLDLDSKADYWQRCFDEQQPT